jgi:hypothetical protein
LFAEDLEKMKKLGVSLFPMLALAQILGIASGNAAAQNNGDNSVYLTTYFSNANTAGAPDATVRIVNDGDTNGNLWAAYYVFDDSQEMSECCSCSITPDGIDSESVNIGLTSNPLTGRILTRGVIKVISSSTSDPTATTPTAGSRGWATHIQKATATTYRTTETEFADSNLSADEQWWLQILCHYEHLLGSGQGVCACTQDDFDF